MNCLITPRGEVQPARPRDGHAFSVTELQDLVGGYITFEEVDGGYMVYDVNGDFNQKLYNKTATERIQSYNEKWKGFVAGNAVLCERIRVD